MYIYIYIYIYPFTYIHMFVSILAQSFIMEVDDDIAGDDRLAIVPVSVAAHVPRRPICWRGQRSLFLVVADDSGLWAHQFETRTDINADSILNRHLLGIIEVVWVFSSSTGRAFDDNILFFRELAASVTTGNIYGYIQYRVLRFWKLAASIAVQNVNDNAAILRSAAGANVIGTSQTLGRIVTEWRLSHGPRIARNLPVVSLCRRLAMAVSTLGWRIFHAVALTQRVNRARLLNNDPSLHVCKRLRSGVTQPMASRLSIAAEAKRTFLGAPADLVIDWLEASENCRNIARCLTKTAKSFAKLFARRGSQSQCQLLRELEYVNRKCLIAARVRLDCVCMNLFRRFWASVDIANVNIYLFADGSPQWRGLELFAVSADFCFGDGYIVRKLLPCVSLPRWMADALSKTVALLWQIWLMVGPSFSRVRQFCDRVRSITTDMGVERLIAGQPDCLVEFYECWLKARLPADIDRGRKFLFPRAIEVGGWKHLFDNLIVRGLSSLDWFPGWLDKCKALNSFLRTVTVIEELESQLIARGQTYAAASPTHKTNRCFMVLLFWSFSILLYL